MPHVLFVCTANICRSPVAEGLLRDRLHAQGRDGWTVASAGTWALQNRAASQGSVRVMADEGIDISDHQARMVTEEMLAEADLILTMETGHAEALRAEFPAQADKVHLLTAMVGREYSISDPYGGPLQEYQRMAGELTRLIDKGLPRIIRLAEENARDGV